MATFGQIISSLVIGAGKSVRRNAGDTDFEAITPLVSREVFVPINGSTALTTSDKGYFRVPTSMNGMNLIAVSAMCQTASSSGTPTFTIKRGSTNMLSTNLTIDANETDSSTAVTPAVIDTANDDVSTGQQIEVACSVAGTGTLYAGVSLTFQLP